MLRRGAEIARGHSGDQVRHRLGNEIGCDRDDATSARSHEWQGQGIVSAEDFEVIRECPSELADSLDGAAGFP